MHPNDDLDDFGELCEQEQMASTCNEDELLWKERYVGCGYTPAIPGQDSFCIKLRLELCVIILQRVLSKEGSIPKGEWGTILFGIWHD